jgi:flagellar biosynthesis protein FlhA
MKTYHRKIQFTSITRYSDVFISIGVMLILFVMVIPIPPPLLDFLITFNIACSVMILFVGMYTLKPLDFSVFPSILLIATLFRLSLNIASTRLILLRGSEGMTAAGQVIKTFGSFVVGGNYVVGMVVFLILVVINFVVITKGAGRVAEVAARFTLDAMPGKQMSIDADLNAGLITENEARQRRESIAREADFYGAMDGASKFIRGDAIAGVIITLINIVGGLIIGVIQQGMSITNAAKIYTVLTVGDGLVTQIPSLIVSTAAGIVVTRTASEGGLAKDLIGQIVVHPRAIGLTALVILIMGMTPGLPKLHFGLLSILLGTAFYLKSRADKDVKAQMEMEKGKKMAGPSHERIEALLSVDPLGIEVGYGLIPLVDREQKGDLLERIRAIRRQFALDLGIIIPPIHIKDNLELKPNEYRILLKGVQVAQGEIIPGHYLAVDPGTAREKIEGISTREPAFKLPALWIKEQDRSRAQAAGYTVVDPSTVVATHLSEILRTHAHELLGRQEVQKLLDHLAEEYPKVVEELIPSRLSLGELVKCLQNLLKEGISIRDLKTILETLADNVHITRNIVLLTEYTRQALSRIITAPLIGPDEKLFVISLDREIEDLISQAICGNEHESYLSIEPKVAQRILLALTRGLKIFMERNLRPIVLCSPSVRPYFKRLTERFIPNIIVLSQNEISPGIQIESLGVVDLKNAD